ncbi:hypothetical protein CANTEDRAFT_133629 [Yamadazyma tenuis ATCC 10573]|uniref:DUF2470 domain-containing protein n=2 Tax=Candida tenuis TaxID=2315449 RepID=G3B066_CANTC|nr:uncharacterized protein CANTEDRAFT_133629 [Yamadazyma tenuis ATCC 10573]EGV65330.1 hypothetical protein CANTEDRAFT_133629 [Yamadazyma tenuis ATCC 10573]
MNGHRQIALVDYLAVYSDVSLRQLNPKSVHISAVDEKSMVLSYDLTSSANQKHTFNWHDMDENDHISVASMSDINAKLTAMAKYAAAKQGVSHIQVTAYPKWDWIATASVAIWMICSLGCYSPDLIKIKNGPIAGFCKLILPELVLQSMGFCANHCGSILVGTLVLHSIETLLLVVPRVRKYRVPLPERVLWYFFGLLDGNFTVQRFDKLVDSVALSTGVFDI